MLSAFAYLVVSDHIIMLVLKCSDDILGFVVVVFIKSLQRFLCTVVLFKRLLSAAHNSQFSLSGPLS